MTADEVNKVTQFVLVMPPNIEQLKVTEKGMYKALVFVGFFAGKDVMAILPQVSYGAPNFWKALSSWHVT